MSDPNKLSDEAFAAIENRACRSDYPISWAAGDVERLIDHVRAMQLEHKSQLESAAALACNDADRVGAARIKFEESQTRLIHLLETANKASNAYAEKARDHILDLEGRIELVNEHHNKRVWLLNKCIQILRVNDYDESMPHSIINQIIAELGLEYKADEK